MATTLDGTSTSIIWFDEYSKSGGGEMNQFIVRTYPITEDAVVVNKYFSGYLCFRFYQFIIKGREDELLGIARDMEAEEKAKCKKG